jgi:hypothetical protein
MLDTNFLRLLSVTTHSTWSRRQFVHGEPFSTTSQRTLRARQQQQALEARRLTGRFWAARPEALRFPDSSVIVVLLIMTGGECGTFEQENNQEVPRRARREEWRGSLHGGGTRWGPGTWMLKYGKKRSTVPLFHSFQIESGWGRSPCQRAKWRSDYSLDYNGQEFPTREAFPHLLLRHGFNRFSGPVFGPVTLPPGIVPVAFII